MTDDRRGWLDVKACAARFNVEPGTWRSYVWRGQAPAADYPDEETPKARRRPLWRPTTLDGWVRPGPGARTEVAAARRAAIARRRAELAERVDVDAAAAAWLATNHRRLLDAAGELVDLRDVLVAVVGDELAVAIDRAGEEMGAHPSPALASAVSYALFLARGHEEAAPLARFEGLRSGYEQVRPKRA